MSWPSGRSGSFRIKPAGALAELHVELYGEGRTEWPVGHPNRPQGVVVVSSDKPVPPVTHDARGDAV